MKPYELVVIACVLIAFGTWIGWTLRGAFTSKPEPAPPPKEEPENKQQPVSIFTTQAGRKKLFAETVLYPPSGHLILSVGGKIAAIFAPKAWVYVEVAHDDPAVVSVTKPDLSTKE